jgi:hypothetical protein
MGKVHVSSESDAYPEQTNLGQDLIQMSRWKRNVPFCPL